MGGDVVEQEERLGACGEHVVDAVRGEILARVAQPPGAPGEHELRADAVGRGREQRFLVERVQASEPAERALDAGRACRVDRRAQPLDDIPCGSKRNPRLLVRLAHNAILSALPAKAPLAVPFQDAPASPVRPSEMTGRSVERKSETRLGKDFAVQLGPPTGAVREEAQARLADLDLSVGALELEELRECACFGLGVVGPQLELGQPQVVGRREELVDPVPLRMHLDAVAGVSGDERAAPWVLLHAQTPLVARSSTSRNSSSSSATPTWSTRGSGHCPGWTTTLTAPRSSSLSRCRNPFCSSSSQDTPASKCT